MAEVHLPFVWTERVLDHVPGAEVWVGVSTPGTEVARRASLIRESLLAAGASEVAATPHDDTYLLAVHDRGLVRHLRDVHAQWMASDIPALAGQDRVVPYVFPTEGMLQGLPVRDPTAVHARAGRWCYDTMTLVGPGTWTAARAAVDAALTAVDLVVAGARSAYALTRPPGHHVTRAAYGGSCYLNNAAVAASALLGAGYERVAVVDVDAHHGNGTQAVFYERPEVLYASVHVDPGAGWFPHYAGFAEETGRGPGTGANRNVALAPGAGDQTWLHGIDQLLDAVAAHRSQVLVVSLGVDAAMDDPESPLRVSSEGYGATGTRLAATGLPCVLVQEGGYHLPTLGGLVTAVLAAFA
ncbi:MAG TPA: histone deacetylase family protein [Actinomycetes bacterium]|nr:histone deacetylase family protein [Actinomycetes bacterium]